MNFKIKTFSTKKLSNYIVEEILRIYGFDQIPLTNVIDHNTKKPVLSSELKSFYKIKRAIANSGYLEAVTWSFMDEKISKLLSPNAIRIKTLSVLILMLCVLLIFLIYWLQ